MSDLAVQCPPIAVTQQAETLVSQGYKINRIYRGICPEPGKGKDLPGWCIDFGDRRSHWRLWLFDDAIDGEAVKVDCEVC